MTLPQALAQQAEGRAAVRRARGRHQCLEPGEGLLHGLQRVGYDLAQPRLDLLDRDACLEAFRERLL